METKDGIYSLSNSFLVCNSTKRLRSNVDIEICRSNGQKQTLCALEATNIGNINHFSENYKLRRTI